MTLLVDPADERSWAASRWLASVELSRPIALTLTMAPTQPGRRPARVALAAADLVGGGASPMLQGPADPQAESLVALQQLGYKQAEAERMVKAVAAAGDSVEAIIRKALQQALR